MNVLRQQVCDACALYPSRLSITDVADGQICATLFKEHELP